MEFPDKNVLYGKIEMVIAVSVILSGLSVYVMYDNGVKGNFPGAIVCMGLLFAALQIVGILGMFYGQKSVSLGLSLVLYGFSFLTCSFVLLIESEFFSGDLTFLEVFIKMFVILPIMIRTLVKARRLY